MAVGCLEEELAEARALLGYNQGKVLEDTHLEVSGVSTGIYTQMGGTLKDCMRYSEQIILIMNN